MWGFQTYWVLLFHEICDWTNHHRNSVQLNVVVGGVWFNLSISMFKPGLYVQLDIYLIEIFFSIRAGPYKLVKSCRDLMHIVFVHYLEVQVFSLIFLMLMYYYFYFSESFSITFAWHPKWKGKRETHWSVLSFFPLTLFSNLG